MAKKTQPPQSKWSRSMRLLGMTGQLVAKEIAYRVQQTDAVKELKTRVDQAKIVAQQLSQLKGAAMKAGQLLSLDTSEYLPKEVIEILSQLQSKAVAVEYETMYKIFEKELGADKVKHFQNFSKNAVAAASIGQIHSAILNYGDIKNEKVAIKIQYPGVSESIDSDISILATIAKSYLKVSGKDIPLDETFNELTQVLKQEANYLLEGENLTQYGKNITHLNEYIMPKNYSTYNTEKILVMNWVDGMHLNDWLNTNPTQEDRNRLAHMALNLYCHEFMDWGLVQTDPNFANYLIQPSPLKLVCLDFGATLKFTPEFRRNYARYLKVMDSMDANLIFQSSVEFGLMDPRENEDTREAFKNMIQVAMEPFRKENQPFQFTDLSYERRTIQANLAFSKKLQFSPPPRKILFLHRKLGGLFNFVKKIGAKIDLTPYWTKMTDDNVSE
jgi:aarF domain-containing kinase